MNCIFCKIVANEASSSKVYEDNNILAFMDIQPVREGQVLVIPKEHIDHFTDIPDQIAVQIFVQARRIARVIKNKLNPERVGFVVHGYGVSHAHMIVVPQKDTDDITSGTMAEVRDGKVIFSSHNLLFPTREELDRIAQLLKG